MRKLYIDSSYEYRCKTQQNTSKPNPEIHKRVINYDRVEFVLVMQGWTYENQLR